MYTVIKLKIKEFVKHTTVLFKKSDNISFSVKEKEEERVLRNF